MRIGNVTLWLERHRPPYLKLRGIGICLPTFFFGNLWIWK